MARRLRTHVHVLGQVYGPGQDVPADVAEKITNPDVWETDEQDAKPATEPEKRPARRTRTAKG